MNAPAMTPEELEVITHALAVAAERYEEAAWDVPDLAQQFRKQSSEARAVRAAILARVTDGGR